MKKTKLLLINCLAMLATVFYSSCKDKEEPLPAGPTITLSETEFSGKSNQEAVITANLTAPAGFKTVRIVKQVNLQPDNTFGTNGVMDITPTQGQTTSQYTFRYELQPDEVDKVVGFIFQAEDVNGKTDEETLTVNTTASGEQIIYTYRWNLVSKVNATGATPVDDTQECEKDDSFLYNEDGSIEVDYGANACTFDGFNEYGTWELSEDEESFTQTYASIFDPTQVTTETYNVTTLNKDRLVMEIFLDLSDFGLSDNEKYVYTFEASPR